MFRLTLVIPSIASLADETADFDPLTIKDRVEVLGSRSNETLTPYFAGKVGMILEPTNVRALVDEYSVFAAGLTRTE